MGNRSRRHTGAQGSEFVLSEQRATIDGEDAAMRIVGVQDARGNVTSMRIEFAGPMFDDMADDDCDEFARAAGL